MRIILGSALALVMSLSLLACGGPQKPAYTDDKAKAEIEQLMTLYKEARTKFVVQLQQLEQAEDCSRAVALDKAIKKIKAEADMSPNPSKDIDIVAMELAEALKKCEAK